MKNIFLLVLFSIGLFGCSSSEIQEKSPQEKSELYTEMGTSALMRGDFPRAIEDLRKALTINPTNAIARSHLGLAYYALGRKQDGKTEVQRSVTDDPKYSDGYINLGSFAVEEKKYPLAKHYFKKALENLEYKSRYRALTNLGQVYLLEGNYVDAKFYFNQSLSFNPEFCQTHFLLGTIAMKEKRFEAASVSFKKSISKLCATNIEGKYQLGLAYLKMRKFERAKHEFSSLIESNPQSLQAQSAGSLLREIP